MGIEQQWWMKLVEDTPVYATQDAVDYRRILTLIVNSEEFDKFLAKKYR